MPTQAERKTEKLRFYPFCNRSCFFKLHHRISKKRFKRRRRSTHTQMVKWTTFDANELNWSVYCMHFTNCCYGILYSKIEVDKILHLDIFVSYRWVQAQFSKSGSENWVLHINWVFQRYWYTWQNISTIREKFDWINTARKPSNVGQMVVSI